MVKQWKKSLEQTDIVSDGEAFPGAHIDQPISEAGGGVDWAEKTPVGTKGSTSSSISGSGYLTSAFYWSQPDESEFGSNYISLTIDGDSVVDDFEWNFSDSSGAGAGISWSVSGPIRFTDNVELSVDADSDSRGSQVMIVGVLD